MDMLRVDVCVVVVWKEAEVVEVSCGGRSSASAGGTECARSAGAASEFQRRIKRPSANEIFSPTTASTEESLSQLTNRKAFAFLP